MTEKALQIVEERREVKSNDDRKKYTRVNREFQRIARRGKKPFLNEQYSEIEKSNTTGKAIYIFTKIGDIKATFHERMGMIKDRNVKDLKEAEDIKKRWQKYKELYKNVLMTKINSMTGHSPRVRQTGV